MESRESAGLLNGMRNMMMTMDKARMNPRMGGMFATCRSELHRRAVASRVTAMLPIIASTPNGTVLGRSVVTSRVATTLGHMSAVNV